MAYDEDLAERIRALLGREPVVEKKMFGGLAFLVDGHMSVAASARGGLMVRIDPDHIEALLEQPGASVLEMGDRGPMKGWLLVSSAALRDEAALSSWVMRGVEYSLTLPSKGRR